MVPQVANLHDPEDNGKIIKYQTSSNQVNFLIKEFLNKKVVLGFWIKRGSLSPNEFLSFLAASGHARLLHQKKYLRIEELLDSSWQESSAFVAVESITVSKKNRIRMIETLDLCLKLGKGHAEARTFRGLLLKKLHTGLRSSVTGKTYKPMGQNSFSFNSPAGACPKCKGFGRVIEINPDLVIPDKSLPISDGAIKPFEEKFMVTA